MTKHVYKTIIFGAGQIGQMTARLLGNSYQIMCFADNDPRKHGQFIGNIPICSPSKAAALLPDLIILGVLDEERRGSITVHFVILLHFACLMHGLRLCAF